MHYQSGRIAAAGLAVLAMRSPARASRAGLIGDQPDHHDQAVRRFAARQFRHLARRSSRDADPEKVFTVVDQIDGAPAIRISGKVWGGLLTKQAYRDYRLIAEFRWGGVTWGNRKTRTRDSGVLLHARGRMGNTGKDFNGPWLMSHEFQIIEGGVGDFLPVAGYSESGEQILPSITIKSRKDRDGENVFDRTASRRSSTGAASTGGDGARTGRTSSVPWPAGRRESGLEWTHIEAVVSGNRLQYFVNGSS